MPNCPKCGLPLDICVCKTLEKIKVGVESRSYGKVVTIIEGIENCEEIIGELKRKLACGGTIKNKKIELQGNHKEKIKKVLASLGYSEENIEIV
ncbi:MAG: stress response translation initiation inhibitor YciH [Candidatus Aenigmarchaeota archaeon]|nr:stress response translation initiation inhibitor YciH [Candidatus Aenigmarchaeota archaeon]MDW8149756.1 stress response translation initiation inhibitor YciH [Candidatus Aenigmarchaeota archaeon]